MARTALGKLAEADELHKTAVRIKKNDAASAQELEELARTKRKSAIRQMKRRPGGKKKGAALPRFG